MVGPVDLLQDSVCLCNMNPMDPNKLYGMTCSELNNPGDCGHCLNNPTKIAWESNTVTGCDCAGTSHWGWLCEIENKVLCKYVDRGS